MPVCYIKDLFLRLLILLDVVNSAGSRSQAFPEQGKSWRAKQEQGRELCSFGSSRAQAWQVRGSSRRRSGGSISCNAAPNPSCPQHYPRGNSFSCLLQWGLRIIISVFQRDEEALHPKSFLYALSHLVESFLSWDAPRARMLSDLGCSQHGGHCLRAQAGSWDLPFDF